MPGKWHTEVAEDDDVRRQSLEALRREQPVLYALVTRDDDASSTVSFSSPRRDALDSHIDALDAVSPLSPRRDALESHIAATVDPVGFYASLAAEAAHSGSSDVEESFEDPEQVLVSDFTPTSAPHATASSSRGFAAAARTSAAARWLRWFRMYWREIIRWALLAGRGYPFVVGGLPHCRREGEPEDSFLARVGFYDEAHGGDYGPPGWAPLADVDYDGRFPERAFGGYWYLPSSRAWRAEGGWHLVLRRAMMELGGPVMRYRLLVVDALRVWARAVEDERRMAGLASCRARLRQAERDVEAAMRRLQRAREEERRAVAAAVRRG